jgi:hypothetical protein
VADLKFKRWFVAERSRALAMLLLTRGDGLDVREAKEETGFDYIARIKSETGAGPRSFGVLVRGGMSSATPEQANAQLRPTFSELSEEQAFMPVCVFYYTMKGDVGFYTWAHEPVVEKGHAKLPTRSEPNCRPLDDAALAEIVSRVSAWYDALAASLHSAAE